MPFVHKVSLLGLCALFQRRVLLFGDYLFLDHPILVFIRVEWLLLDQLGLPMGSRAPTLIQRHVEVVQQLACLLVLVILCFLNEHFKNVVLGLAVQVTVILNDLLDHLLLFIWLLLVYVLLAALASTTPCQCRQPLLSGLSFAILVFLEEVVNHLFPLIIFLLASVGHRLNITCALCRGYLDILKIFHQITIM